MEWVKNHPEWIEKYYSKKMYTFFYRGREWFFHSTDTSIGDGLYLLFFVVIVLGGLQIIGKKRLFSFKFLVSCLCLLFLWFELSWGLNYYRVPLSEKMGVYSNQCASDDLFALTYFLALQSNQQHKKINATSNDGVEFSYAPSKIIDTLVHTSKFTKIKTRAKKSWYSTVLLYTGFSGYLNPFTLEAHINEKVPMLQLPVTIAHEMAHQEGYAAENEANFIGFARTFHHPDPYIRYSSLLFGFKHCYAALKKSDPELASEILQMLSLGIRADYDKMYRFWEQYKTPIRPYAKKSYDQYLKANGQSRGIDSYSEVVRLMIRSYSQNPENPFRLGNNL